MKILLADDQPDILEALRLLLEGEGEGEGPAVASSPDAILAALKAHDFDVLLMDLDDARDATSGREGLELLARIRALDEALPVVVMTARGDVARAAEAMRRGARDYIEKPWDNTRLLTTLRAQAELGQALRKIRRLELENASLRRRGALEEMTLDQAEKSLIQRALARSRGNITDAARSLGLSRSALYRRLQHFGLRGAE